MAKANKPNSVALTLAAVAALALVVAAWLWLLPSANHAGAPAKDTHQTSSDSSDKTADTPSDHADMVHEFTSSKGATIKIKGLANGDTVTSPLTITGEVRGNWSFEANFPIELTYGSKDLITFGSTSAMLTGDWMTTDYVPFTATLTFTVPIDATSGVLILRSANPSDSPANDDSVNIAVKF